MAYTPHTLCEFGGILANEEIWACTIRGWSHNGQGPVPIGDLDEYLEALAPLLSTWFASGAAGMANAAFLTYVKLNNIAADGKYAETGNTHVHDYPTPVAGNTIPATPNFLSVAYTWETGRVRGRAHRGRMYTPNFGYAFTGAIISNANAVLARQAGVNLIHDVFQGLRSAPFEDEFECHVFSKLDGSHYPIIAVTVDNVYDVQRRRKNQISSTRTAPETIPSGP